MSESDNHWLRRLDDLAALTGTDRVEAGRILKAILVADSNTFCSPNCGCRGFGIIVETKKCRRPWKRTQGRRRK